MNRRVCLRQNSRRVLLGAAGLLLAAGGVWFGQSRNPRAHERPNPPSPPPVHEDSVDKALSSGSATPAIPALSDDSANVPGAWDELLASASAAAAQGPDARRTFVHQLFAALDRLSPADRTAVIEAFFASNKDIRFGNEFTIGPGGFLQDWPTLRVALFDFLAQRDGASANVLADQLLLNRPDEPGEWTLALRELARGKPAGHWDQHLQEKLRVFLSDPEWQTRGPRSWLEGFDVVVAGQDAVFLTELSVIASDHRTSRAARFAAFLAADRLVLSNPADTFAALNRDATLFAGEPNVRAGLFARTDVRQAAQLRELEVYMQRTDVSDLERARFGDLFPLYDLAVSTNLLTAPPSRPLHDMLGHDRAVAEQLSRWASDARWARWQPQLQAISARLAGQLAPMNGPVP